MEEWNGDPAYRQRMAAYRRCTLVIRWDRVPGARWALNMPEGALKRTAIARLGREAPDEKIPLHGACGKFIATERRGDDPLTVAINSPHATASSWSYWPCTDIDLSFGTVAPSVPKTISGTIRFLRGRLADVVEALREPLRSDGCAPR